MWSEPLYREKSAIDGSGDGSGLWRLFPELLGELKELKNKRAERQQEKIREKETVRR